MTSSVLLIVVKNKDGNPAPGVAVRIDGRTDTSTDKDGAVIGWSTGHVGRIEALTTNSWNAATQKSDIEIPVSDELFVVELLLP